MNEIRIGDCREIMKTLAIAGVRVQTCITSPPYFGLRDYGTAQWEGGSPECNHRQGRPGAARADGIVDERAHRNRDGVGSMGGDCQSCGAVRIDQQIGLEETPAEYVARLVEVFRLVRELLADDGTLWLNLGDSYAGSWGNYGGQNRAAGKQRAIVSGSRVPNPAWDERTTFLPPAAKGFPGIKPKDLIGIPWRVAFALQADGWYLRSDIIWHKPNPMPESVTDRPTKSHEYIFLLTKSAEYFYDADAIKEDCLKTVTLKHLLGGDGARAGSRNGLRPSVKRGGFNGKTLAIPGREAFRASLQERNKRSVWTVPVTPYFGAHFATFPTDLILPCVLAGSRAGDIVFDPFMGSGTTALVAKENGRRYLGCELNPEYRALQLERLRQEVLFGSEASDGKPEPPGSSAENVARSE